MDKIRQVILYKNYFLDFYDDQPNKLKDKIEYVLYLITVSERIPVKFLKHILGTEGLYEIRVEFNGNIYRIFSCFDEGSLVVLFNGFQKKSEKTLTNEIEKALRIMTEYFFEKNKS